MYEKLMYKVPSQNNKVIYRLQDFTKNDNVNEDMFVEGRNTKGDKRLQCQVYVLHTEELEAIQHEQAIMNERVEELNNKIMQKNVEIKRLQKEIAKHKRANITENMQLLEDKFNMLQEHESETRKLEKIHQKEVDKLKESHLNEVHDIDETHKEILKQMRSQYTSKLDKANDDLIHEVKENNNALDKLKDEMLDLKETHKQEVITLQNEHHKELEDIQHAHSNELQQLQKQHTYDIDELKQAIANLKQEHLIEINEIEHNHIDEVEQIRVDFMRMLSLEHAKDLSELNECDDVPFYVKPFIKSHMQALDEFKQRKYNNTPQKIIETYELAGEKEEQ